MPPQSGNQVQAGPSPSFLEKIQDWLGYGPLPDNVRQAIDIAKREGIPTDNIQKMGPIGRFFAPSAAATTTPGRNVQMNMPQMVGQSPNEIADVIAHENTHVNQISQHKGGLLGEFWNRFNEIQTPYAQRPDEMEAYQVEKKRKMKRGEQAVSPSFSQPGKWNISRKDVNLPYQGSQAQQHQDYMKRIRINAGLPSGIDTGAYVERDRK